MTRRQLRIGTALVLVAAAGWLAGCQIRFERRTEAQAHALPAEAGDVLQELARPSALEGAPLAGGYRWTGLAVQRYEAPSTDADGWPSRTTTSPAPSESTKRAS